MQILPIPECCWGKAPPAPASKTFAHVFTQQDTQARAWVSAIVNGKQVKPDLADGLAVQRIMDAAQLSAAEGRRVTIAEVVTAER